MPEGTVVKDLYSGEVLAELYRHGDRFLAAAGGRGGRGNAKFLINRRRAPSFAEQGEHGEERWLKLELQLMADVALVGFPNAGKSTLISVISAAKPKIADYPFTTLEPNLGVVALDDDTNFVVADIPGLIEGASEGRGLGHQFLRHIERARVLCLLIDLASTDDVAPTSRSGSCSHELGEYRADLLERPRLVVGTKADAVQPEELEAIGWDHPVISAVTGQGVRELVGRMAALVHEARQAAPEPEGLVVIRPEPTRSDRRARRRARVPARRPRGRAGRRAQRRHDARGARLHRLPARAARCAQDARPRRCPGGRRRVDRRVQLRVPAGPVSALA